MTMLTAIGARVRVIWSNPFDSETSGLEEKRVAYRVNQPRTLLETMSLAARPRRSLRSGRRLLARRRRGEEVHPDREGRHQRFRARFRRRVGVGDPAAGKGGAKQRRQRSPAWLDSAPRSSLLQSPHPQIQSGQPEIMKIKESGRHMKSTRKMTNQVRGRRGRAIWS